jgi:hypothetical protein
MHGENFNVTRAADDARFHCCTCCKRADEITREDIAATRINELIAAASDAAAMGGEYQDRMTDAQVALRDAALSFLKRQLDGELLPKF